MYWEAKIFATHLIAIFAFFQWSGTEPTVSLRYAYNKTYFTGLCNTWAQLIVETQ